MTVRQQVYNTTKRIIAHNIYTQAPAELLEKPLIYKCPFFEHFGLLLQRLIATTIKVSPRRGQICHCRTDQRTVCTVAVDLVVVAVENHHRCRRFSRADDGRLQHPTTSRIDADDDDEEAQSEDNKKAHKSENRSNHMIKRRQTDEHAEERVEKMEYGAAAEKLRPWCVL